MNKIRKIALSAGLLITIAFGSIAVLTPAAASNRQCPQSCPPVKKLHGYPCQFAGCDPATNACLYAC